MSVFKTGEMMVIGWSRWGYGGSDGWIRCIGVCYVMFGYCGG